MLRELYSRETPNGIYKEASKMCLANTDVNSIGKRKCGLLMIGFYRFKMPWVHRLWFIQHHKLAQCVSLMFGKDFFSEDWS
jgi:hypothetical protein